MLLINQPFKTGFSPKEQNDCRMLLKAKDEH